MKVINDKSGPIEVWLKQDNMAITCMIAFEDESTDYRDVDSLSVRGAQREMTGWLITQGYTPVNRWSSDTRGESVRQFKPATK